MVKKNLMDKLTIKD
uniref:Uncharacterized protein n=1 Tax=Anguilla anguilla TaxID=7936 RepID=A0A0E9W425_ANGAN